MMKLAVLLALAGCMTGSGMSQNEPNTLTSAEQSTGWKLLFDGQIVERLARIQEDHGSGGMAGRERRDTARGRGGRSHHDATSTRTSICVYDWKISPGGNSGVIYRVTEDASETYETGPEMQILDDARHSDGKLLLTSAGSDFGLYPVPRHLAKPAGEWNHARIVVKGNHVEHWLNGVHAVDYELGSADWSRRVANSKFKAWPGYGKASSGYIALQDHEAPVSFRNIKIRVLP